MLYFKQSDFICLRMILGFRKIICWNRNNLMFALLQMDFQHLPAVSLPTTVHLIYHRLTSLSEAVLVRLLLW